MSEELPGSTRSSPLEAWRMALAGLEAERARLLAKYDGRIAGLKKAIKELEKSEKAKPGPEVVESAPVKPKRARKAKATKG